MESIKVKKNCGRWGGEYYAYIGEEKVDYLRYHGPFDCYGNKTPHGYENC